MRILCVMKAMETVVPDGIFFVYMSFLCLPKVMDTVLTKTAIFFAFMSFLCLPNVMDTVVPYVLFFVYIYVPFCVCIAGKMWSILLLMNGIAFFFNLSGPSDALKKCCTLSLLCVLILDYLLWLGPHVD